MKIGVVTFPGSLDEVDAQRDLTGLEDLDPVRRLALSTHDFPRIDLLVAHAPSLPEPP